MIPTKFKPIRCTFKLSRTYYSYHKLWVGHVLGEPTTCSKIFLNKVIVAWQQTDIKYHDSKKTPFVPVIFCHSAASRVIHTWGKLLNKLRQLTMAITPDAMACFFLQTSLFHGSLCIDRSRYTILFWRSVLSRPCECNHCDHTNGGEETTPSNW